jgi:hypothetical protein
MSAAQAWGPSAPTNRPWTRSQNRQCIRQESPARLGERGGALAPSLPGQDPKTPAPHQWLDRAVERCPIEHQRFGEAAERDWAPQVDGYQQGKLRGGQI